MRLKALQSVFFIVLAAGVSLVGTAPAQAALSAAPGSPVPAAAHSAPAVDISRKNVLVLHAFEANMPINVKTDQGLTAALDAGGLGVKQQFFEYLDLTRNPGPEHRQQLSELLHRRYGQRKIDLIVTLYAEALQFVIDEGGRLFPDAPVLALYLPPAFEAPQTDRRIIRHSVALDMTGTLEGALKLVPEVKRVYVVAGVYPGDKQYEDQARREFTKWEDRLEFSYLSDRSLEDMLAAVSSAPSGTIVFFIALIADITGKTYTPRDVVHLLSQASAAPVFGLYDTLLGYGIAGGSLVSFEHTGTQAARLALQILADPSSLPDSRAALEVPPLPMFDGRQLRHWQLDENALPYGSIVINKSSNLWDHKYQIIGALSFIIAQSALIFILVAQRRRKKTAEESLKSAEAKYGNLYDSMMDGFVLVSMEGKIKDFNESYRQLTNYAPEELLKLTYQELTPDKWHAFEQKIIDEQVLPRGYSDVYEKEYRKKDGTLFPVELRTFLLKDASGRYNGMWAIIRDVTKRKFAEQALEERLRFELLVSDLSARFVRFSPDRVDSEIEHGLRKVLEFFQVDRAGLVQILPDKDVWMITHFAYSEFVPPVPTGIRLPASINPWAYEKLSKKRETVIFSSIDEAPPEAGVDRKTWTEWGIRSNLVIPIHTGNSVTHAIGINSVKSERKWPEDVLPRLQLLGEIFVNSIERKRLQEQIEQALKFQEMLSVFSANLASLPSGRVDAEIEKGLQQIGRFLDLDRCVMALFSEDKSQTITSHSWVASGVESVTAVVGNEMIPWVGSKILRSEPAIIPSVDELPEDASKDKAFFNQVGIKSGLYLPLMVSGEILGMLGVGSLHTERAWPEELVRGLKVAADIFSNTLARQEKEHALSEREKELQILTGRLILGQEEERKRLARELHDDLSQRLAVIAIETGKLHSSVRDEPGSICKPLLALRDKAIQIAADVHDIARRLHPSILDDLGLAKALESECARFAAREGTDVAFSAQNIPVDLPQDVSLSVYRIVQESLNNIAKHACARRVTVALNASETGLHLKVEDDGIGFDAAETRNQPGLGLSSIRERVRLVHGKHRIRSEPDKGTTIEVTLPLEKTPSPSAALPERLP
jgi:PAS domain S-box-containing protein